MLTASGIIVMKDELNQNSYIQRTIHILYMKKKMTEIKPIETKTKRSRDRRRELTFFFLFYICTSTRAYFFFFKKLAGPSTFYKLRNKLYIVLGLFSRYLFKILDNG